MRIRSVAVVGTGTMGAGIAALLARSGVQTLLVGRVPPELPEAERHRPERRRQRSADVVGSLAKAWSPAGPALEDAALIRTACLEDDAGRLADCDWIIEAVPEDLSLKRRVLEGIFRHARRDALVSSTTSTFTWRELADALPESGRRRFLVTHFFNPPCAMYLVEVVRGDSTSDAAVRRVMELLDRRMGRGVLEARDTPGLLANRVGLLALGVAFRRMIALGLSIEEADAITGAPLARPKTGSWRLVDLIGVDVAEAGMDSLHRRLVRDESRDLFAPPVLFRKLVLERRTGRKTGAGFYRRIGGEWHVLDLRSLEYRPVRTVRLDGLTRAREGTGPVERLRRLVNGACCTSEYAWRCLSEVLDYAARRIPEVTCDPSAIDRALRWGWGWRLGPFEAWDALGVSTVAERLRREGRGVPPIVERLLGSGPGRFYTTEGEGERRRRVVFDPTTSRTRPLTDGGGVLRMDDLRVRRSPLVANPAACVWYLGGGVLGVELQTKKGTIRAETLEAIDRALDLAESGDYAGVVLVGGEDDFSLGADLRWMLSRLEGGDWKSIDSLIRRVQRVALRLRYCDFPTLAAVRGRAFGGGCELPMGCDAIQVEPGARLGLVEAGVGLLPAAGGTREMACRAAEGCEGPGDPAHFAHLVAAFDLLWRGAVTRSAAEARAVGLLRRCDPVTPNPARVLEDARRRVVLLAESGYRPPPPRAAVTVAGRAGLADLRLRIARAREGEWASEHDALIGERLAQVLCGGDIDSEHSVDERHLLELERVAFLRLLGEPRTRERIAFTLETGRRLRN